MKEERYQKILDILEDEKYVTVEDLSERLFVSMPTIRRDLNEMQKIGLITRNHGGAMRRQVDTLGQPIVFRTGVNAQEKLRLAKAAATLLHDDCVIFLDESTTTLHIIDHIPMYRNVTVVTNSMNVLTLLNKYKIPSYCTGGQFSADTMSFVGSIAEEMVQRFGIDIMFFSSSAISDQGCILDYCEEANDLRRKVLSLADKKVFLCDSSKFGKRAAFSLCPLSEVDHIVINAPLPEHLDTGNAEVMVI